MAEEAYQTPSPRAFFRAGRRERSAQEGQLQAAESAPMNVETGDRVIRAVGPRTFILQDGVWTDTAYLPESMPLLKIGFLSTEYFQLLGERPDLAAALALGRQVIVVAGGQAYAIEGRAAPQPGTTLDAPRLRRTRSRPKRRPSQRAPQAQPLLRRCAARLSFRWACSSGPAGANSTKPSNT